MRFTVLVVEDRPNLRKTMSLVVSAAGGMPIDAGSVQEALPYLSRYAFDAALIDLSLIPDDEDDRQGFEVVSAVRKSTDGTHIAVFTAVGGFKDAAIAHEQFHVSKCFGKDEGYDIYANWLSDVFSQREKSRRSVSGGTVLEAIMPRTRASEKHVEFALWGSRLLNGLKIHGGIRALESVVWKSLVDVLPILRPVSGDVAKIDQGSAYLQLNMWSRALGSPIVGVLGSIVTVSELERQSSVDGTLFGIKLRRADTANMAMPVYAESMSDLRVVLFESCQEFSEFG